MLSLPGALDASAALFLFCSPKATMYEFPIALEAVAKAGSLTASNAVPNMQGKSGK